MRTLAIVLLLTSTMQAQKPLFPLPKNIDEIKSTAAVDPAVVEAMRPALVEVAKANSCMELPATVLQSQDVSLAPQRSAVAVRVFDSCTCDRTGNCPVFLLERDGGAYKVLLTEGTGYGYSVLPAKGSEPPDVLIASHSTEATTQFQRFRMKHGRYQLHDCEAATLKAGNPRQWDPGDYRVIGCEVPPPR